MNHRALAPTRPRPQALQALARVCSMDHDDGRAAQPVIGTNRSFTSRACRSRHTSLAFIPRAPFRARGMPQDLIDKLMEGLVLAGYEVLPEFSPGEMGAP